MAALSTLLLRWYARHARTLPWRNHPDPYAVWVSEIMLQQTRVDTVTPYYLRWMKRFPTIAALAAATQQEVLSAWEGLGYYGRARNLHRAAQIVMQMQGGSLPAEVPDLLKLPGIGRYTAAAISSLAFGKDEPTLDGNIRRVLSRLFNVTEEAHSAAGESKLWQLAAENLPAGRAGEYNQALMELGALICTPRAPQCPACPLLEVCQAKQLGVQEQRPVMPRKPAIPRYIVTAAVIEQGDQVLIARRPQGGLLGGMWEFPGGKQQEGEDLPGCLQREIIEELGVQVAVGEPLGVYQHAYTHYKVTLHAFRCRLVAGEPQPLQVAELCWVAPAELTLFPMGKIDRRIAQYLVSSIPL